MADPAGSTKATLPRLEVVVDFRFFDVRQDSKDFGRRTLKVRGYGKQGSPALFRLALDVEPAGIDVPFRTPTSIGALTFDHVGETVDMTLAAPPAHRSNGRPTLTATAPGPRPGGTTGSRSRCATCCSRAW